MKKKKTHYVNNKELYDAIKEYQEKKRNAVDPNTVRIPNYVGECIVQIATKLSNKPCFSNYSFKEEMIGDAIENCILYFDKFNLDNTKNPFAYFTTVIYYAFIRRIQKEEKNRYIMYKSFYDVMGNDAMNDDSIQIKSYENIEIFIEKFEAKETKRKKKASEKKALGLEKYYATEDQKSGDNTASNTESNFVNV